MTRLNFTMNTAKFPKCIRKSASSIKKCFWYFLQHSIHDDRYYIILAYWLNNHRLLNLDDPKTFNEKLQWLKLYGFRAEYTTMADKFRAKDYVAERIGTEYVVPLLGAWENVEAIDFDSLPNQFVLKCNHNSGSGMCICSDKSKLDFRSVKEKLKIALKENYYLPNREKPYRDIPKMIIAEKFLDEHTGTELRDYKFWCFDGKPIYMYCTNKGEYIYENFYDMDFNPVMIDHGSPRLFPELEKPEEFELMKSLASELSKGIPFVRVDFFDVDHHVYFGEFTFFDWGGSRLFHNGWDEKLGELITLPTTNS